MLWDTHCHVYKEYYDNIEEVLQKAKENKVEKFIINGVDSVSNEEVLETINKYDSIYGCLGIHPENVMDYQSEDLSFIEQHIFDNKIIGIGEIGLDYHYSKDNIEQQKELFEKQLQLALKYNVPVVIHSREATNDTIEILKKYPKVKGVIHSFSLSKEVANIYINMGYKLGINGVVTFKNCHLKDILKDILPYIILETDSPYLTPHPYRGTKNEPKYILDIAKFIVNETDITMAQLEKITNDNILEIFKIK